MKNITALFLSLVLIFGLCACNSSSAEESADGTTTAEEAADTASETDEVYTLVFSFSDPETNNQYTDIFKPYFDLITEATDGRVQFECHFNGELVGLEEAYDATAKGTVDIAYIRSGSLSYCPFESLLENPPITGKECTRSSYVMNQLFEEYPELAECYTGVKFLLRYQMYYGYIGTTDDPIETYDDFKGKTLIIGSALAAERVEAYGGTPLDVLPADFYTSLEKGLADGAITVTQPEMISYSWADVIKNITLVPVIKGCAGLIMNEDAWNNLPADIQEAIESVLPQAIELADAVANDANSSAIEMLKAQGINYIEPSEEFIEAMRADNDVAVEEYIASLESDGLPNAGEIYDRYLELYNEYSE